jgi:hypothetical protein
MYLFWLSIVIVVLFALSDDFEDCDFILLLEPNG